MPHVDDKNPEIERAFRTLEHVFTTVSNAKACESNKYPLGDPNRVEADLSEIEKSHLGLLRSRLNATIAQEQLKGVAKSSEENRRFSRTLFVLNVVIAVSTVVYTLITWWSVRSMREGNEIQRQILELQKQSTANQNNTHSNGQQITRKGE
jgi:hypothetical protein